MLHRMGSVIIHILLLFIQPDDGEIQSDILTCHGIAFTKTVNHGLQFFSCFVQKWDILLITYVCRRTGCIKRSFFPKSGKSDKVLQIRILSDLLHELMFGKLELCYHLETAWHILFQIHPTEYGQPFWSSGYPNSCGDPKADWNRGMNAVACRSVCTLF